MKCRCVGGKYIRFMTPNRARTSSHSTWELLESDRFLPDIGVSGSGDIDCVA
jgi:hypothetical protein